MTNDRLWTAEEVGRYLGRTKMTVLKQDQYIVGFPRPIRLPTAKGRGHPRWVPEEIRQWAMGQREVA